MDFMQWESNCDRLFRPDNKKLPDSGTYCEDYWADKFEVSVTCLNEWLDECDVPYMRAPGRKKWVDAQTLYKHLGMVTIADKKNEKRTAKKATKKKATRKR
ncbi:hypothetical protein CA54_16550 [Symmachiella macrocystis]|uniref:Uncharacterized protein n=1 Tax=Symmachiella macrocystis TaxID=2527985 RepID=A0A5C6BPA1_9PLAN|nr:hypothetical protein CA54_16550 [Symmachiella macrocystis]